MMDGGVQFGNLQDHYRKGRSPLPYSSMKIIFSLLGENGLYILDVGCGTGISTRQLSNAGANVVGLDHDVRMLMEAVKIGSLNTAFSLGSAETIPFQDKTFTAVSCFSSFHWFQTPRANGEFQRVLKAGGKLVVVNRHETDDIREEFRKILTKYIDRPLPRVKQDYHPAAFLAQYGWRNIQTYVDRYSENYRSGRLVEYLQSVFLWNLVPRKVRHKALAEVRLMCQARSSESGIIKRRLAVEIVSADFL
jgi:ubiquinone/menaquinone biosynthesis C-methylase UbiE